MNALEMADLLENDSEDCEVVDLSIVADMLRSQEEKIVCLKSIFDRAMAAWIKDTESHK